MKTPKPLFRRIICFSVPIKERFLNSNLYRPAARRGSFSEAQDIWIVSVSDNVTLDLKLGDQCLVSDSFELEPTNLDLWDKMKDLPEFAKLKKFVEDCAGQVVTQVVMEDSVLAIVEPD